jgi:hypothetical protein
VAVTKALKTVREQYYEKNLKSSNKMKLDGGNKEMNRVAVARDEILRMREAALFDSDTNAIEVAMEGQAHNCEELARIAAFVLQEDLGIIARVGDFGGVHAAAIIGAGTGPLPSNMKEWDANIYICDPWANIACRARDYPEKFDAKMTKWQDKNKLVKYDDERKFVPSRDDQWMSKVLEGDKSAA